MSLMLLVKPSSWPWGSCVATSPCDDQRKFLAGAAHDSATATQSNTTRTLIAPPLSWPDPRRHAVLYVGHASASPYPKRLAVDSDALLRPGGALRRRHDGL